MADLRIPPVGEPEREEPEETEVLRLYEVFKSESEYMVEVWISFMSDYQVFRRVSINGVWQGTSMLGMWKKDSLERVANCKAREGWEITWNPLWQPGLRLYTVSIPWA